MYKSILAAALCLGIAISSPAMADETKMQRVISLTGQGQIRLAPDLAIVTAGVVTEAEAASGALAANAKAMQTVLEALKSAGIDEKDTQTSNFSVQPRYDYSRDGKPPVLTGYAVSNNVTITVRKVDNLGRILDQLVSSGSNQIQGVQFSIEDPTAAQDEARRLAIADARRKAELYATASNVTLGNVLTISEGVATEPRPIVRARMVAEGMVAETPIAVGEQTLTIDVNVTWEIN